MNRTWYSLLSGDTQSAWETAGVPGKHCGHFNSGPSEVRSSRELQTQAAQWRARGRERCGLGEIGDVA